MKRTPEPEWMDDEAEARVYDEADFRDVNTAFAERAATSFRAAQPPVPCRLVDVGTGPAEIPLLVLARLPGATCVAIDAAPEMLDRARQRRLESDSPHRLALLRGVVGSLPFGGGRFDGLISNSVVHHLVEPRVFWREARRVLRPGGRLQVQDLCRPATEAEARAIVDREAGGDSELLQELFHRSLLAAYTVAEIEAQIRAAGWGRFTIYRSSDRHWEVAAEK